MSKGKTTKCPRVPIVTILGHVDHGKTTLLDSIRKSNVQGCEVGGITQRVSVFTVNVKDDKKVTFVDTPGHEAFDLMRSRGGSIADIVLLIVAADDGVMPQTKESIEIIKNSKAKPIVVITKCDLPNIELPKIKRDISNNGMQIEELGGSIPAIEVSAKSGKGLEDLLDLILLVSDVEGLQDRGELPSGVKGKAFVLESVKDCYKGNISSLVFTQGGVCPGDFIGYKTPNSIKIEKVKGIITEESENICILECGCGGKILGISNLLELGTEVYILEKNDEKILEGLFKEEQGESVEEELNMEDFFSVSKEDTGKHLNVIVKASSEGSLEAIRNAISKIKEEDCTAKIIKDGVGNINLRDVESAMVSKAIVLGFEVSTENGVEDFAKRNKVLLRTYDIIYKLLEEISDAVSMMALPEATEEEIGNATVKTIFVLSNGSKVYGSRVESGIMKRDCKIDAVRNDEIIGEGKIKSLRINKDVVNEVKNGFDCGIQLEKELEILEGDKIYCYKVTK
ncbi:MAG: GTP-binding protein [Candidatus Dojkabacteria bacterium]|nr:GTP-binding protein [Candidatus Dojkabacteria bacterium]